MTLLLRDPLFHRHDTGAHPERAARLRAVDARLDATGLAGRCVPGVWSPLPEADVTLAHEPEVLDFVKQSLAAGARRLEADTAVSPDSLTVALNAAGACAAAADAVLAGEAANALCLVRPPGHHATPSRSMGFCLFNSVALAARKAQRDRGVGRVLVVDWDVHHGNGTQDIFYDDDSVMFVSLHRFGGGFYPGTGDVDETGTGPGLGWTRNVPLRPGTSREEYRDRFRRAVEQAADKCRPDLILLSAGFDAHENDPLGAFCLRAFDFGELTRDLLAVARAHCGGRLVACLEGGYDLDALADSVESHLSALLEGAGRAEVDGRRHV